MILVLGMILDAILGEPKWLWTRVPHPAVVIGRIVNWCDKSFNHGDQRRAKGILTLAVLLLGAALLGKSLQALPGHLIEIVVVAILLAQKSLTQHVTQVALGLKMSLPQARRDVAMIVGRDTANMDESNIARSAIESAAENFSDGIIAPAFWFLIGGLPGLLVYKVTNTADSMIGYQTQKHEEFGWAAARFDDLINLIPARLTAILIWLTAPTRNTVSKIIAEAPKHRSPNAGWPEAAMAYNLDIALSGPRSYDGELRPFPYVNADGAHELSGAKIEDSVKILWKSWGLAICAALLISLF